MGKYIYNLDLIKLIPLNIEKCHLKTIDPYPHFIVRLSFECKLDGQNAYPNFIPFSSIIQQRTSLLIPFLFIFVIRYIYVVKGCQQSVTSILFVRHFTLSVISSKIDRCVCSLSPPRYSTGPLFTSPTGDLYRFLLFP